jgi:hypothetical protein
LDTGIHLKRSVAVVTAVAVVGADAAAATVVVVVVRTHTHEYNGVAYGHGTPLSTSSPRSIPTAGGRKFFFLSFSHFMPLVVKERQLHLVLGV